MSTLLSYLTPCGVFLKENIVVSSIFKRVTSTTQDQMLVFPSFSFSEMKVVGIMKMGIKSYPLNLQSALPCCAPQGGARLVFCETGWGGAACFSAGRGEHPWWIQYICAWLGGGGGGLLYWFQGVIVVARWEFARSLATGLSPVIGLLDLFLCVQCTVHPNIRWG